MMASLFGTCELVAGDDDSDVTEEMDEEEEEGAGNGRGSSLDSCCRKT